jgi:hypothetical protein
MWKFENMEMWKLSPLHSRIAIHYVTSLKNLLELMEG